VTDRHAFLGVAETNPGQQRPSWHALRLNPRLTVVVTQQDMASVSHRHQALTRGGHIEKKRARGERRMLGEGPRGSRRSRDERPGDGWRSEQRGDQRERRRRQMPQPLYRTPLICSALG